MMDYYYHYYYYCNYCNYYDDGLFAMHMVAIMVFEIYRALEY